MGKTLPSCQQCRREGKKLFLKGERCLGSKCALVKRNYPPGQHGVKKKPRLTPFGLQLREKQRAKRVYGIRERQFRNYYEKAVEQKGDTGETLLWLLEHRLDNIIYRAGFAKSRNQARQFVGHGAFLVNNKKVDIPSYQSHIGDRISLRERLRSSKVFQESVNGTKDSQRPGWITVDPNAFTIEVVGKPTSEELSTELDVKSIIEFYSR